MQKEAPPPYNSIFVKYLTLNAILGVPLWGGLSDTARLCRFACKESFWQALFICKPLRYPDVFPFVPKRISTTIPDATELPPKGRGLSYFNNTFIL